ncbi:hypothetical protein JB92DRAFT_3037910 [Gautieria morchelliformis]|nr:hypothetical protein JB92DRAFT_3037910 [Gautieria morchelliformis]
MMYIGALLRLWCYKALGTALVRHPSYTASILHAAGMALAALSPHGYVRECGLISTPVGGVFIVWVMVLGYVVISLLGRSSFEDVALHSEFGVSWETYQRSNVYLSSLVEAVLVPINVKTTCLLVHSSVPHWQN